MDRPPSTGASKTISKDLLGLLDFEPSTSSQMMLSQTDNSLEKKGGDSSMSLDEFQNLVMRVKEDASYSNTNFVKDHLFPHEMDKHYIKQFIDEQKTRIIEKLAPQPEYPSDMVQGVRILCSRVEPLLILEFKEFVMINIMDSIETILKQRSAVHRKFAAAHKMFGSDHVCSSNSISSRVI